MERIENEEAAWVEAAGKEVRKGIIKIKEKIKTKDRHREAMH